MAMQKNKKSGVCVTLNLFDLRIVALATCKVIYPESLSFSTVLSFIGK